MRRVVRPCQRASVTSLPTARVSGWCFAGVRHGYVIELKCLQRSACATEERVAAVAREAQAQFRQFLADERLTRQYPSVHFDGLALVFHGWQLVDATR